MVAYFFFRLMVLLIGWMPFRGLYICADGVAFLMHRVFRYRRAVILKNLRRSFPGVSEPEIQRILNKTYCNLSDITLEGIKGMTCTEATLIKRYKFINPEVVTNLLKKGSSVIGLVAHYTNWEWGALVTEVQIKGPVIGISKSIHNPYIDRFIRGRRARFGATIVDMPETARAIINHRDQPTLFVLIADQSPSNARQAHWIEFLHQETACLVGPDKLARNTNYPVVYFDVQRKRRGHYEIQASLLEEFPDQVPEKTITRAYFKKLSEVIHEEPANWLWSHRRWKKRRVIKHSST